MDRSQAAALLGVDLQASEAEARKAYLARARIMHPDRFVDGTDADKAAATKAMAQLNEAIEVFAAGARSHSQSAPTSDLIVVCPECGKRNRTRPGATARCGSCGEFLLDVDSSDSDSDLYAYEEDDDDEEDEEEPEESPDFPTWPDPSSACTFCGWGPARPVTFNSVIGIIIWWRWSTVSAVLCRECATFVYNQEQASTLVKGWWGIIAPVANVVAFVGNWGRYRMVKRFPEPVGKCWHAPALVPFPLYGARPWWERIGPLLVVGLLIALGLWIGISVALSSPATSSAASPGTSSGATSGSTADDSSGSSAGDSSGSGSGALSPGDCIGSLPTSGDIDMTAVTAVQCSDPHVFEVTAVTAASGTLWSLSDVEKQADDFCQRAFTPYVGAPVDSTSLVSTYLYPTQEGWIAGDRTVTCLVSNADETSFVGSVYRRGADAAAAPNASPAATQPPKPKRTTVTLNVSGCDGCIFTPFSVRQDEPGAEPYTNWKGVPVTIAEGTGEFVIPTRYTEGMSLQVNAPWESGQYGAVVMATLAPDSFCWEGTTSAEASLDITTVRLESNDEMYGPSVVPNAYLSSLPKPKYAAGHQDLPYCQVAR